MTNKIVWRLKEQPTSESLRELVRDKILTNDEAREILFNLEEQTDRDNESFKSEIKFLRELVEKLANSQKVVEIIREIKEPYYRYPWWSPYGGWTGGAVSYAIGTNLDATSTSYLQNFSDIKTF